jgi:RES domain-containing protein
VIRAWRLARRVHSDPPQTVAFNGKGAEIGGGRWNPPGLPAAYASASRSLAALEKLAHIDPSDLPDDLVFSEVAFDEADLEEAAPPPGWSDVGSVAAQLYGERWLREARSLVLAVPSVVIAQELNYVINPRHPRASSLQISTTLEEFIFDERLFKARS